MSKTTALVTLLAIALVSVGGCASAPTRMMTVEITGNQGLWRLDGVASATVRMDGWQVGVSETEISDVFALPYLKRFVLAIVNTSSTQRLYLEPREIFIVGLNHQAMWLGPPEPTVLEPGQRITLTYDKGSSPLDLLYPFTIHVTAFGAPNAIESRKVIIKLH